MDDLEKKEMFKHLDTLDGRDLMYFLILDCMEKSQHMDMDGLTAFLDYLFCRIVFSLAYIRIRG